MKVLCPVCKGTGKRYDVDWGSAVFSLGMTLLMDLSNPSLCDCCKGRGWIYDNDKEDW